MVCVRYSSIALKQKTPFARISVRVKEHLHARIQMLQSSLLLQPRTNKAIVDSILRPRYALPSPFPDR